MCIKLVSIYMFFIISNMEFDKYGSLKVDNMDIYVDEKEKVNRHSDLLPNSIRCIICGPSNCGKTNIMITLLTHLNGVKFENVYLYTKSLFQPKYKMLSKILARIKGVCFFTFSDNAEIVPACEARPNSIFIFDDVAIGYQETMRDYFSMGRHRNVDSFYLYLYSISQTYTRISKHLCRDNTNLLILFKMDDINLKHIYEEHVGNDMSFEKFRNFCAHCWGDKYGFVVIDKDRKYGRYRKGFDAFLKWCV